MRLSGKASATARGSSRTGISTRYATMPGSRPSSHGWAEAGSAGTVARCYPRTGQHSHVNEEDGHVLRGIVHQPIGDEERAPARRTRLPGRASDATHPTRSPETRERGTQTTLSLI